VKKRLAKPWGYRNQPEEDELTQNESAPVARPNPLPTPSPFRAPGNSAQPADRVEPKKKNDEQQVMSTPSVQPQQKNSSAEIVPQRKRRKEPDLGTRSLIQPRARERKKPVVPALINVRNWFSTTKKLADDCAARGMRVILVDNASTYEPLLDWYSQCPYEVVRLATNLGHHAPWLSGTVAMTKAYWYVVSDCDLDIGDVPQNVNDMLMEGHLQSNYRLQKCGLSLKIDDLPEWQSKAKEYESQYWKEKSHDDRFYIANTDTTFAMYSIRSQYRRIRPAWRTAPPYCARHIPWYIDCENMNDEERFYFNNASRSNSWKPDGKGLSNR
jgi:hypothetical protein